MTKPVSPTPRIPCIQCGAMILPVTAQRNDGLCGQCMNAQQRAHTPSSRRWGFGIWAVSPALTHRPCLVGRASCDGILRLWLARDIGDGAVIRGEAKFFHEYGGRDTFEAEITYRYEVNGQEYTSDVISPGPELASNTNRASTKLRRLIQNGQVAVYYNPANHGEAVLEQGFGSGALFAFIFFAVFFLILSVGPALMHCKKIPSKLI